MGGVNFLAILATVGILKRVAFEFAPGVRLGLNGYFQSSWSAEDQQALDKIAKKLDIDLEASDLAGVEATFTSIEVAASKIGRAVTQQVIEDLAIKQTKLLDQPQPCPDC